MLFGIPPHLIGDVDRTTSWGTGIAEQTQSFLTYTLQPWVVRAEALMTEELLETKNRYAKFNLNAFLRAAPKDRWEIYRIMRTLGAYNNDEIREMEDDDPIPDGGGTDYLQPLNSNTAGGADNGPDAGTKTQPAPPGDDQKGG
jgi:HK97 family phage portal protein